MDQSEHSSKALDFAIQIAKKFAGEITLIHVYSSVLPIVKPGSPTLTSVPVLAPEYSLKMIDITRDTGKKILSEQEANNLIEKVLQRLGYYSGVFLYKFIEVLTI